MHHSTAMDPDAPHAISANPIYFTCYTATHNTWPCRQNRHTKLLYLHIEVSNFIVVMRICSCVHLSVCHLVRQM